jgi:adenine phosphoribosyltransferase
MWQGNRHAGFPTKIEPDDFSKYCRVIEDFPKQGVSFKDITPLLLNGKAFNKAIQTLSWPFVGKVDSIVCIEARGFLIGAPMAFYLNCGLVPIRKRGKLPGKTHSTTYDLEYGTDTLEIHADAIKSEQRILIVDDVLATGGTAKATINLIRELHGNVIGCAFLGEITDLNSKNKFDVPIHSLIKF